MIYQGPRAGVWVITETDEFDTFYARIVVTDDQGRYLLPDLLAAAQLTNLEGGLNTYLTWMKTMGCIGCHHLGNAASRTLPTSLGEFESHEQA